MLKHKWLILISLVVLATILPLNGLVAAAPETVAIRATDPNAAEKGPTSTGAPDPGTFTVYRVNSPSLANAITVYYALSGTAINGMDYLTLSGVVTIPAGAPSATITVKPIDDNLHEGTETVIATIIPCPSTGCYFIGAPNSATVYIADND